MEEFFSNWDRIHAQSTKVMRVAPSDKFEWKPVDGAMTLGELMCHFPGAEGYLVGLMTGSKIDVNLEGLKTADDIVEAFDRVHEAAKSAIAQLSPEQLDEEVSLGSRKMTKRTLLYGMLEHEIHHRGQLYTYVRIAGVIPPPLFGE